MLCFSFTRVRKAKIAIAWYFFVVGSVLGNVAAIIPSLKDEHNLNNGVLGAIMVASIGGAMLALPGVTYCNDKFGCGISTTFGSLCLILLFPVVALNENIGVLIVGIFLFGFGAGWTDVSVNGQAVLCEKMTRTPILGLFHCIYALGGLVGALIGGLLIQHGVSIFHEVVFLSFILILPGFIFSCWLFSSKEEKLINQASLLSYEHVYDKLDTTGYDNPVAFNPITFHPDFRNHKESNTTASAGGNHINKGGLGSGHSSNNSIHSLHIHNNNNSIVSPLDRFSDIEGNRLNSIHHNSSNANLYLDDGDSSVFSNSTSRTNSNGSGLLPTHKDLMQANNNSNSNNNSSNIPSTSVDSQQTDWQVYNKISIDGTIDYKTLLKLCSLCFIAYFGEGSVGDWSAVFLTEDIEANDFECTLGFVGFQLFVAFGRLYSDYLVLHVGRKKLLQLSGVVSAIGLVITVISPVFMSHSRNLALSMSILGFSLCGAGLSVVAPSVISLAGAGISGMSPAAAIANVSLIGYLGIMVGPPLLGSVSLVVNLRYSFLLVAIFLFCVTLIATFVTDVKEEQRSGLDRESYLREKEENEHNIQ